MAVALNATQDYLLLSASHTTSDATETFEAPKNVMHKGVYLIVERTAETGTCTLDVKLQMYAPEADAWIDLEGAAITQFADGATGDRYLYLYPGVTGSDADDAVTLDTNEAVKSGHYLPRQWRVHCTTGGTSVSNTFSVEAFLLP